MNLKTEISKYKVLQELESSIQDQMSDKMRYVKKFLLDKFDMLEEFKDRHEELVKKRIHQFSMKVDIRDLETNYIKFSLVFLYKFPDEKRWTSYGCKYKIYDIDSDTFKEISSNEYYEQEDVPKIFGITAF